MRPKQQYPEPIAGGFIFNEKHELFLIRSHKWNGAYVPPGGHVEVGETLEEALKREIKEETNMDITDIQFIEYHEFINKDAFFAKRHFIFFNFSAQAVTTNIKLNEEAEEYIWVPLSKALTLPLVGEAKKTIEILYKKHHVQ